MTSLTKNAPLTSVTVRDILWYKCLQINVSSWFAKSLHQTVLGTSQRHHSTYAPEGKGTNDRACHHIMARSKTLRGVRRRVWEFSSGPLHIEPGKRNSPVTIRRISLRRPEGEKRPTDRVECQKRHPIERDLRPWPHLVSSLALRHRWRYRCDSPLGRVFPIFACLLLQGTSLAPGSRHLSRFDVLVY